MKQACAVTVLFAVGTAWGGGCDYGTPRDTGGATRAMGAFNHAVKSLKRDAAVAAQLSTLIGVRDPLLFSMSDWAEDRVVTKSQPSDEFELKISFRARGAAVDCPGEKQGEFTVGMLVSPSKDGETWTTARLWPGGGSGGRSGGLFIVDGNPGSVSMPPRATSLPSIVRSNATLLFVRPKQECPHSC